MKRNLNSGKRNFSRLVVVKVTFLLLTILFTVFTYLNSFGQNPENTFEAGSYIIDMGEPNPKITTGLKPYGLIYQLIVVEEIPVSWAINSSKVKDGIDFSADGKNFRGGPFIIANENITESVLTLINIWKAKGVVVYGPTVGGFTAPVYKELTSWPLAVLDAENDSLITIYYTNAEIPTSSYLLHANPTMLTGCEDMYILPHAEPDTWDTSMIAALKYHIDKGGYVWVGCRAGSILERIPGCNFLSNDSLILWDSHVHGTPSYTYNPSSNAHPIMQFMGIFDAATLNGSEQIYVPGVPGWRSTTTLGVYDADYVNTMPNPDVAYAYPNAASALAYGFAFGDTSKGMMLYQSSHSLNSGKNQAHRVAAQRAFFNFILMAGMQKPLTIEATFPDSLKPDSTYLLIAKVKGGNPPYTYLWSSIGGGTFSRTSTDSIYFTAPSIYSFINITLKLTDTCGRVKFRYANWGKPLPVEFLNYNASYSNGSTSVSWSTASETNNNFFSVEKSLNLIDVSEIGTVAGAGNSNTVINYLFTDKSPGVGEVYYRIRQTDYDGATDATNWMVVDIPYHNATEVFLDNVSDQIQISFGDDVTSDFDITVSDMLGRCIASYERPPDGESIMSIDFNEHAKGIYIINIATENYKISKKLVLE